MTVDEPARRLVQFPTNIFDSKFKSKCLSLLLQTGLPKDDLPRVIPPCISNFLFGQLPAVDFLYLLSNSQITRLYISDHNLSEARLPLDVLRAVFESHVEELTLKRCNLPSKFLDTRDILSLQGPSVKLVTLNLSDVSISTKDLKFLRAFGTTMERISNLRFGSVISNDSVMQSDEIFITFARDNLSKNRNLSKVDLRGSDIDLVATSSRRNLQINFAAEMRRWARRLRSLAFESDVNVCRILRILNRQCPLLRTLCLQARSHQDVSSFFDNLKFSSSSNSEDHPAVLIEPLNKLERLCLCCNFRINDSHLSIILPSLPALKYLNASGCPVNFESYWHLLPISLEELILDELDRERFLFEHKCSIQALLRKCANLKIYISPPIHQGSDLESLRGLALLTGAHSCLHNQIGILNDFEISSTLKAFELRVIELNSRTFCINLF